MATEGVRTELIAPDTGLDGVAVSEVDEFAYKGPNITPVYFKRPDIIEKVLDTKRAFAALYIACERPLGFDREIANVNGSGIGLGYPVGCPGTSIVVPCWPRWIVARSLSA